MAVDLAAYRQESLDIWGEMAPGWEARREWIMEQTEPVLDWLVERADPKPGGRSSTLRRAPETWAFASPSASV
jgi:hypothetical protein